jgi:regulator of cell morphogenesis and NO signaling
MARKDWSKVSEIELIEHIQQQHFILREKLQKLQTLIQGAAELHREELSGILNSLQEFFPDFKTKLENHFVSEERILLPYIRQMVDFNNNRGPRPEFHTGSIKNPISQMEYEHDLTENVMLAKIRDITNDYKLPPNSGDELKALYDGLKDIETILNEHIYIENNVLFQLAIELELNLKHKK